jgi:hypothetical protein
MQKLLKEDWVDPKLKFYGRHHGTVSKKAMDIFPFT